MKKTITLSLTITATGLLNIISASAITYQNNTDVDFALNPTINVTLSSNDLVINDLAPGSASDSNIITVGVSTNAGYGYYLSVTANTSNSNTNLTHETSESSVFTNLSSNKTSLSNFSDNTWGYSYCRNGSVDCSVAANWISGDTGSSQTGYNGLPLDNNDSGATGTKLLDTTTYAGSGSVQFKIGAKASNTQAAGTYNGTVNFYAVIYRGPVTFGEAYALAGKTKYLGYYKMQDMNSSICTAVEPEISSKLIDVRDNQVYTVAKLKDNKCWMTENLNIAGSTALSADTTDVDSTYVANFTTSNNLTKGDNIIILPVSATKNANDNNLTDPTQFSVNNYSYVFNSGNKTNCGASGQNIPCYSYYSWDAATLGSGRSISAENTDAPYSVCPKGWRLPTSGAQIENNGWKRGDFYRLATAYGARLEDHSYDTSIDSGANFYNNAGPNTVPNFLISGVYYSGEFQEAGLLGFSYSATSYSNSTAAHYLYFGPDNVYSARYGNRRAGRPIRCLFSGQ